MGVKLQSSLGGSVEIAAPSTANNYTLTAPAGNGTVDYLQRAGNVLQVVNATYSTQVITTSTTEVNTGLSASITPTSSSSKILVSVSQNGIYGTSSTAGIPIKLYRNGSTVILAPSQYTAGYSTNDIGSVSGDAIDSPNTTSLTTYRTTFLSRGGAPAYVQNSGATSTITLMEIAG